jgi:bifunctional ADP-heptose synthase (sugar kinase/adenylyltransferase)
VHGAEEAVDVTGAGDTVSATFALALGSGASAFEAARLANVAGSLVVQKPGTATVSRAELERELSR